MNYMLPLYLDYLERPKIYEGLFYKELGIISEKGPFSGDVIERIRSKIDETVQTYSKNKAARDAKRALKGKSKPIAPMKLKASHKTAATTQRKIGDLKALNKKTHELTGKTKTVAKRKIGDLKTLNKKTQELSGKTKAVVKKAGTKWSPKAVKAGKTAAKGSEFGTTVVKKAAPKVASTIKPFMKKAGMVGAGAAAAYGGYKLYKRHFSKAAQKCKGKSGSERTLCLQQATRS